MWRVFYGAVATLFRPDWVEVKNCPVKNNWDLKTIDTQVIAVYAR